jgi:hypothetical protein
MLRVLSSTILFLILAGSAICQTWKHLDSAHLRVYFTGGEKDARRAIREGEEFLREVNEKFALRFDGRIEVWICRSEDQFRRSVKAPIQDWAAGCAFPFQRRILIRDPGFVEERNLKFLVILRHEMAHVLIGERVGRRLSELPLWFNEGMAMLLSGEGMFFRRDLILMSYALWRSLIPLRDLESGFPDEASLARLAYAESLSAVSMIRREYGRDPLIAILDLVGLGERFSDAMTLAIGTSPYSFDERWRTYVGRHYKVMLILSSSSFLWMLISATFLIVYINYRRIRREKLERMIAEEENEDEFFR